MSAWGGCTRTAPTRGCQASSWGLSRVIRRRSPKTADLSSVISDPAVGAALAAAVGRALGEAPSNPRRRSELVTPDAPEPVEPWGAWVVDEAGEGLAVSSYSVDWIDVLELAQHRAVWAMSTADDAA